MAIVLSHYQIAPLLRARDGGLTVAACSPDLNRTQLQVTLEADAIHFPDGERLAWDDAEKIERAQNTCFELREGALSKIQSFSELTIRPYSLYPTPAAPTMLVAGFPMHRIKETDPYTAAQAMVKTLSPVRGIILDTATGLGYTAIELSKTAERVITIELDPAAQEIARRNPWSSALFDSPKIEQRIGDSFKVVREFENGTFDAILHDPPTMALAGDLYSEEIYRELYRVLKRGGKLFHYIGDAESKFGAGVTRGVTERLKGAGFARVTRVERAYGVAATKR